MIGNLTQIKCIIYKFVSEKKQTKNHVCEKIMFGILVHVLVSVMSMCIVRLVKIQNTAIV